MNLIFFWKNSNKNGLHCTVCVVYSMNPSQYRASWLIF